MSIIESAISPSNDDFVRDRDGMLGLIERVRSIEQRARDRSASRERFEMRGQLLPRDRLALLLYPGTPLLELSTLAGFGLDTPDPDKSVPGDGVIAGIGVVSGIRCMISDNPPEKVKAYLDVMKAVNCLPEFECFDVGIVRCVNIYQRVGMYSGPLEYNFVMGVESGMPTDPELLPVLKRLIVPGSNWQVTAIGRKEIWPLHRRVAELGGFLRTGLEDTFYLPDGSKATSNGQLIKQIASYAREAGRSIANAAEARALLNIH